MAILYLFIALAATTAGAVTGLGGGVIIKPALDFMGHFDAVSINVLSTVTVFSMAIMSVIRHGINRSPLDLPVAIPLALGSVAGGYGGQCILAYCIHMFGGGKVVLVQNAILGFSILLVYSYMKKKEAIKPLEWRTTWASVLTGLFLGCFSSFLGIGGGPVNVALILFVFDYDIKEAAVQSIVIILFSQATKLFSISLASGFTGANLSVLPYMVTGALLGGNIGYWLNRRLSPKSVECCFNILQFIILGICIVNVCHY